MFRFEVHTTIQRIIEFLYRLGLWHRNAEESAGDRRLKLFYITSYSSFLISLAAGAFENDNQDEQIFLIEAAATTFIMLTKLWYLLYRQKKICKLLNGISSFSVDDRHTFNVINHKLKMLMRFTVIFLSSCELTLLCETLLLPFIGSEKKLFVPIGFPLDWRHNESAYWIASIFLSFELVITGFTMFFSAIVWYLIASCSWRYEVLGQQMKKLGEVPVSVDEPVYGRKVSNAERDNLYLRDLAGAIKSANDLKELTDQLQSLLSTFFAAELAGSGICICVSIFCIAFIKGKNFIESAIYLVSLVYHFFDIFMITFYGNEIKLASDRLPYCLFESNWLDRPQSIKKNVLVVVEILAKPRELMILKMYPLTLATFSKISNSVYSMFNILKRFK